MDIASPSHLLQRCWWEPPTLLPLFHFRWQHTRHQFCSQDSSTAVEFLKQRLQNVTRSITFLMVVVGNIKISRTSLNYVPIKRAFPSKQSRFSFQLATGNHHVMELVLRWSLQRPLNNQVLDYCAVLEVWQEEMKSIIFFGIDKEEMFEVREKMEKRFEDGNEWMNE